MDEDAPHSSVDSGTTAAGVGVPAPLPLSVNSQADIVIPMDNHDATPMKFHSNSLIIGPRAERTAKFLLGLVASLVVGYKAPEWFGWNFTYSIPLFYCMAGALLPPKVSTISLLWSLAFPAGLLVAGWVTLICWLALFADSENGRAHVMCWGYVLLVMMASLLKTGPLAALNQIPLMIMAYGGHLGLFYLFTFVREGAVMKSMTRGEIMLLEGEIVALYPKLEMYIKMLFIKIFAMMDSISPGGDPLSAVIPVPAFFEQISSDFRFMMGEGMHIEVYHDFIRATLPPDPWILRVFWHATDMLCTGQAIIIGGSVALGILTTTLLLPPQRYMRSFLRTEMTSVTSTISAWMQFFADDDVPTPSGTPRNPMKCLSSVKGVERVARMLQDARMDPMAPRMRRLASDTDPEIELLRLSESLNKLSAAVLLSTFEASLRHPGIFSFYVPQLVKVLANLQSLPPHMLMCTRVGAQLNDGHFGAEIHTRLLGDVRFGNTLHDAADLLHMTAVAISTKPVNSGAAFFAYCQTKHNLHEAIFRHVTHRSAIRNRVTRSLHESVDNPLVYWRNALTESILLLTYEGAVIEKPLKLAHSVLELMEAQQKERAWLAITNILLLFAPVLFLLECFLKFFITIATVWKRQWKPVEFKPHSEAHAPTVHLYRIPFWRGYEFRFCCRLISGAAILTVLPAFWSDFRHLLFVTGASTGPISHLLPSKFTSWPMLGFMTSIVFTLDGTLRRSLLRLGGVCLGTFSGWLCLLAFPTSFVWQIIWISTTSAPMIFLVVNPVNPLLGFNPSWGYVFQLFTYQQIIIIIEAYFNIVSRDEIVVARLVAQLVGISSAVVVSLVVAPTFSDRCLNLQLKHLMLQLAETSACLVELSAAVVDVMVASPDETPDRVELMEQHLEVVKKSTKYLKSATSQFGAVYGEGFVFGELQMLVMAKQFSGANRYILGIVAHITSYADCLEKAAVAAAAADCTPTPGPLFIDGSVDLSSSLRHQGLVMSKAIDDPVGYESRDASTVSSSLFSLNHRDAMLRLTIAAPDSPRLNVPAPHITYLKMLAFVLTTNELLEEIPRQKLIGGSKK